MNNEAFLESGETLSLKCAVLHLNPGEASELHWYRGNNTTPLDEIRSGVLVETDLLTLTSHLQVSFQFLLKYFYLRNILKLNTRVTFILSVILK